MKVLFIISILILTLSGCIRDNERVVYIDSDTGVEVVKTPMWHMKEATIICIKGLQAFRFDYGYGYNYLWVPGVPYGTVKSCDGNTLSNGESNGHDQ